MRFGFNARRSRHCGSGSSEQRTGRSERERRGTRDRGKRQNKETTNAQTCDVEEFFLAKVPVSSAEVRGLVTHDIKKVEGVRQQEDQRDEEERDEVNGEVEEITHRALET